MQEEVEISSEDRTFLRKMEKVLSTLISMIDQRGYQINVNILALLILRTTSKK